MPSLELAIQSQGMVAGGAAARGELDQIIQKGHQAERSLGLMSTTSQTTGASMREAFGAGRGALNLSRGLQGVADSMAGVIAGNQSLSTTGLAAAGVMLQISRTAEDWRNMSTAVTTTQRVVREATHDVFGIATGFRDVVQVQRQVTTGAGALWAVMRAHPLMFVAAAITTVSGLMSTFGGNISKAKSEWDQLGESMQRAQLDEKAAAYLGIPGTDAQRNQMGRLRAGISTAMRGEAGTVDDLVAASGMSRMDVLRFLANQGHPQAAEYVKSGQYSTGVRGRWAGGGANRGEVVYEAQPGGLSVAPDDQKALLRAQYLWLQRRVDQPGLPPDFHFPPDAMLGPGGYGPPDPFSKAGGDAYGPPANLAGGSYAKAKEQIEEMSDLARELHGTFADAGATLLQNLSQGRAILRDMVGTMLHSLLRQGISSATEGFFGSFGKTPRQQASG